MELNILIKLTKLKLQSESAGSLFTILADTNTDIWKFDKW